MPSNERGTTFALRVSLVTANRGGSCAMGRLRGRKSMTCAASMRSTLKRGGAYCRPRRMAAKNRIAVVVFLGMISEPAINERRCSRTGDIAYGEYQGRERSRLRQCGRAAECVKGEVVDLSGNVVRDHADGKYEQESRRNIAERNGAGADLREEVEGRTQIRRAEEGPRKHDEVERKQNAAEVRQKCL